MNINEGLSIGDFLLSPWLVGALILLGIALFIFMVRIYNFPETIVRVISFAMVGVMMFIILAVGWLTIITLRSTQSNEVLIELPTLPVNAGAGTLEPLLLEDPGN